MEVVMNPLERILSDIIDDVSSGKINAKEGKRRAKDVLDLADSTRMPIYVYPQQQESHPWWPDYGFTWRTPTPPAYEVICNGMVS